MSADETETWKFLIGSGFTTKVEGKQPGWARKYDLLVSLISLLSFFTNCIGNNLRKEIQQFLFVKEEMFSMSTCIRDSNPKIVQLITRN